MEYLALLPQPRGMIHPLRRDLPGEVKSRDVVYDVVV
jgi:hypothetical protein